MKPRYLHALSLAIGALAATTILMAPAVTAATKPKAEPQTTIYADTFTPLKRFADNDSEALEYRRFYSGPGNSPNLIKVRSGYTYGVDAFFNSPDLTIGPVPMSAVSAEICLKLTGTGDDVVVLQFGIQDKDRNFILWLDPDPNNVSPYRVVTPSGAQQCEKLTFATPVKLVNHPHLVVAMIVQIATTATAEVDGVTYTLQPTQDGDLVPSEATLESVTPTWFKAH